MNHRLTNRPGSRGLLPFLVLLLAVLAPAAGVLAATDEEGQWEAGLYAGYGFLDDYAGGLPDLNPDDDALFGVRLGYFTSLLWSAEGSFQQLSSETDFTAGPPNFDFDLRSYRFNVLRHFRPEKSLRPFATLGVGLETTDVATLFNEDSHGINFGAGLRWLLSEHFGLRADARWVTMDVDAPVDNSQSNLEATIGAAWRFGGRTPGDADGDGVPDRDDECPDTPQGAQVNEVGCPRDSDGDGVFDGIDRCPDTPKGANADAQGCPRDSDGDGVFDGLDRCAGTPPGAIVDAQGCPRDTDGDGVFDGIDQCPGTPDGVIVNAQGCPQDTDGDGVFNGIDRCPNTRKGVKVDSTGCAILFEEGRRTLVLEGVNFEFDSDRLTQSSTAILDGVAASLKDWSEVRVEVAGHTDSKGRDDYNLDLSQRRAESVRHYLIDRGISASRLVARGYGEARPAADNDTETGRGMNRRVELRRLD